MIDIKRWRKKFFRKLFTIFVPIVIFIVMRILWITYRKKYHFIDKPIEGQRIAVSWHGELLLSPQVYRVLQKTYSTSAIISRHFDGELIAKVLGFFNISPLRGSTNSGARQVLINSLKAIKAKQTILLTPDGPRGPRHSMSDGAVALALKSKLPIMAISYIPSSYWQLNSWDEFVIPKPFSRVDIYHQIININNMQKDKAKKHLQSVMNKHSL